MSYGMAGRDFQGDPFLGGLFKKIAKIGIGAATSFIPGGRVATDVARGIFGKKKTGLALPALPGGFRPGLPHLPPSDPRTQLLTPASGRKRGRINPANPKALRRAIRRQDGFVKLARRALKGSGYTIVSRGSRRPKRDLGAGHTHVR